MDEILLHWFCLDFVDTNSVHILYYTHLVFMRQRAPCHKNAQRQNERKNTFTSFSPVVCWYGMLQKCPSIRIFNCNVRLSFSIYTCKVLQNQECTRERKRAQKHDDDKMYGCYKKCDDKMCPLILSMCNLISKFSQVY